MHMHKNDFANALNVAMAKNTTNFVAKKPGMFLTLQDFKWIKTHTKAICFLKKE